MFVGEEREMEVGFGMGFEVLEEGGWVWGGGIEIVVKGRVVE